MDTEHALSPARAARATTLLVALVFALGFAEFALINDLVGFYALACAVATPAIALATARTNRFKVTARCSPYSTSATCSRC